MSNYKQSSMEQLIRAELAQREMARRNLIDFTKYTKQDFEVGWFNKVIAKELQQFYQDVIDGKQPRLMIFAPPRSGKSELFSRRFPSWVLGKNPDLEIISASYSADLSSRMNKDVQRIIEDESYKNIFPDVTIPSRGDSSGKKRTGELFEIVNHSGAYRSSGVGGGITGMGFDIGIIDDPIKDAKEANSETVRNAIWDWYTTTFYTRKSPRSGILLGMTRWHDDDLASRLIKEMESGKGEKWKIISFPAIAEEEDEYRHIGEPLHPERFPLEILLDTKKAVGSHVWNAMYQQRPISKGGNLIKGDWFGRYKIPPIIKRKAIFSDTALKIKQSSDYSVFLVCGVGIDNRLYLLDLVRGKWEANALEQTLKDVWNKHKNIRSTGALQRVFMEDKASGTSLIQRIKNQANIPIKGVEPKGDKYSRLMDVQGYIENGTVMIPENAPWVADFIEECEKFTADDSHLHDDQVDTLVMAIKENYTNKKSMLDIL